MTDKYEAPFEGGKTPDPNRTAKVKNIAKNLARKAMKKAAAPMSEGRMKETLPDDDAGMSDYEHYMQTRDPKSGLTGQQIQKRKEMDAADFKKRREEMNAKRQVGTKPLSTTYREEVELDEAKDKGEYDYEGDMAMSQLKSIIANAQKLHDMMEPDANLPEWVQSKITLAEDYIVTAANYMEGQMDEEVEQIDELSKDFLTKKYGPKAMRAHLVAKSEGNRETANKRAAGVNLAAAKAYPNQFKGTERAAKVAATNEEVEQVEEGLVGTLVRAYVSPKAQSLVGRGIKKVAGKLGASQQTQRRLQKAGMQWAKNRIGEDVEQIEERAKGYEKLPSARKARADRGELAVEAHDPVGKEDADINNDGKTDKTDVYLHTRRRAIGKAINNRLAAKAGK